MHARRVSEIEIGNAKVSGLLDARPSVVEKQQYRAIAQSELPLGGQSLEQVPDLPSFQEASWWWWRALGRNGRNAFCLGECLRYLGTDIVEKAAQRRQPMVPSSDPIAPLVFQVLQEAQYALGGEVWK